tara:strand:- start:155 stop:319 length:165 start_codon:yes stop_codon:yes gene_type:complete
MTTDTASWFIVMFYFMVGGVGAVCGTYLIYWLIMEMPVLVRIKHEELYERWRNR